MRETESCSECFLVAMEDWLSPARAVRNVAFRQQGAAGTPAVPGPSAWDQHTGLADKRKHCWVVRGKL